MTYKKFSYSGKYRKYIHCVPKKHVTIFYDKLKQNYPFTKIFGALITKSIFRYI